MCNSGVYNVQFLQISFHHKMLCCAGAAVAVFMLPVFTSCLSRLIGGYVHFVMSLALSIMVQFVVCFPEETEAVRWATPCQNSHIECLKRFVLS